MAGSAEVNGRLWGARARAWSEGNEQQTWSLFESVIGRSGAGPGVRLLDLACGAGLAAQLAAQRGAQVTGIDASDAMIEIARERTPEGRFEVGDLEALPFRDGEFDVVTSFNGIQYAASPLAALREARRVLKPGGNLVVVVWAPPEGMEAAAVIGALRPLLPPPPPGTTPPGPFALSEAATLTALVAEAGFEPVTNWRRSCPFRYLDLATAVRDFNATGVAVRAIETSGEDAVSAAHEAALRPFVRAKGRVEIDAAFTCVLATA